eukprot:scpid45427/ scgid2548/ Dermatan-sulfate epimerase; Chondroitin-glucuronate 5-epimerase; Squamous cell carcinoma antigen recognized by T-cells 2
MRLLHLVTFALTVAHCSSCRWLPAPLFLCLGLVRDVSSSLGDERAVYPTEERHGRVQSRADGKATPLDSPQAQANDVSRKRWRKTRRPVHATYPRHVAGGPGLLHENDTRAHAVHSAKQAWLLNQARQARADHPMLLFGKTDVGELALRAVSSSQDLVVSMSRAVHQLLVSGYPAAGFNKSADNSYGSSSQHWEHLANNLILTSFMAMLKPQEKPVSSMAVEALTNLEERKHWMVTLKTVSSAVNAAHALLSMSIAYDLLYHNLTASTRHRVSSRVIAETAKLERYILHRPASASDCSCTSPPVISVALLAGSLASQHDGNMTAALLRQNTAKREMEQLLEGLQHVTDGSVPTRLGHCNYMYATRAIFLYMHLARRHLDADHSKHPWLLRHFSFMVSTAPPGYLESTAIPGNNNPMSYGPEAQFRFLDSFAMKNGHGYWLAEMIRLNRTAEPGFNALHASRYHHMQAFELLWNVPGPTSVPPDKLLRSPSLTVLPDWGGAVYGAGPLPGATHLGVRVGHAIVDDGDQEALFSCKFAGQHAKQQSLFFSPHGKPFITEPVRAASGQLQQQNGWEFRTNAGGHTIGSCTAEDYKHSMTTGTAGDAAAVDAAGIITALEHDGVVFVLSELVGMYCASARLKSHTRALFLLDSDTLLVVDAIEKQEASIATHGNVFWHSSYEPFESLDHDTSGAAQANGQNYIFWFSDQPGVSASTGLTTLPERDEDGNASKHHHYLNVSVPLEQPITRIVWLLTANPNITPSFEFSRSSGLGVELLVNTSGQTRCAYDYRISLVTGHSHVNNRYIWHCTGSLARIELGTAAAAVVEVVPATRG